MQSGSGDYAASYFHQPPPYLHPPNQNPSPNQNDRITGNPPLPNPPTFASAPPFSTYNPQPDMSSYTNYSPFSQNFDPVPTAPSFSPQTPPSFSQFNYQPPPPVSEPPAQTYTPPAQTYTPPAQTYTPPAQTYPPPTQTYPPPAQTYPPPATVPYNPYESHPPTGNYGSTSSVPATNAAPSPGFYSNSYPHLAPPVPSVYDHPYETSRLDESGAFRSERSGGFRQGEYGRTSSGYDRSDGLEDGVYAYDGGRMEPYGARGTGGPRSSSVAFDDYGRSLTSYSSPKEPKGSGMIVRAVPKADPQQDVKNGVQKFRVKLLAESSGQSTMDVLCQIGLDGIRMLDPNSNRTLRIYPLETVTRWVVNDPSIYTFWAKTSVDIDPRRIRLQSNSYTTSTILDTITAATVQLKEMGGKDTFRKGPSDSSKLPDPSGEKKKGLVDWMNLIKPANEEKDHWVPDEVVTKCTACGTDFGAFVRKHHCRNCGDIFCDKCTHGRIALTADPNAQPVRVCDRCLAEVSQRLSNAKEAASRPSVLSSHEDLARKLQEEMERNRKSSSASKSSDGSGRRMREVACPTCTVHLQVQVPASGSETIECGVCQHPFLVSAH